MQINTQVNRHTSKQMQPKQPNSHTDKQQTNRHTYNKQADRQ